MMRPSYNPTLLHLLVLLALVMAPGCGFCGGDETDAEPTGASEKATSDTENDKKSERDAGNTSKSKIAGKKLPDRKKLLKSNFGSRLKNSRVSDNKLDNGANAKAAGARTTGDETGDEPKPTNKAAPRAAAGDQLDVRKLLNGKVVRDATSFRRPLRTGKLEGIAPSDNYGSVRLRHARDDKFGVALQVWTFDSTVKANSRFNNLARQYPGAKRGREVGDGSLTSSWGGVSYVVWLDRTRKAVGVVSCDDLICDEPKKTLELAQKIAPGLPSVVQ